MTDDFVKRSELPAIIKAAVREALDEYEHKCVLALKDGDSDYAREIFSMIREVGHGDLGEGITEIRENTAFISRYRRITGNIGTSIITVIVLSIAGLVGTVLATGAVAWVKGIK